MNGLGYPEHRLDLDTPVEDIAKLFYHKKVKELQ
jgi:hypothetical protein